MIMKKKDYQEEYAAGRPQMYDTESRKIKATRMVKTLADYFGKNKLKNLTVLDVGSSTGIIDNELAPYFKKITGIDIDTGGVKFAKSKFKRKNLSFKVDDAMNLSFKNNSFDIVICAQIYEHVPNDIKLMSEIYRVLKPSGICYLAALNRLWPMEPHHNLLFLSWLPKSLGNAYVKIAGKSDKYCETLRSYWSLRGLTKKFIVHDYTEKILRDPKRFSYDDELPTSGWKSELINIITPILKYNVPTYFWLLEKPER